MLRVRVRVRVSIGVKIKVRVSSSILAYCRSAVLILPVAFSEVGCLFATQVMTSVGQLAFLYEMNVTNIALRCLRIITTLEIFMNNAVFLLILWLCQHFWPTVLSVEPLVQCAVCRLSVWLSVVCNVLYCGKTLRPSEKVSEGVNRKPG